MSAYDIIRKSDKKLDAVYEAMKSNDLSECVMAASKFLKETHQIHEFEKQEKCPDLCNVSVIEAKRLLDGGEYQKALMKYNTALMFAPLNSEEIIKAYYGRAEVLFQSRQFSACLKDIETCLAIKLNVQCSDKITKKIIKLKNAVRKNTDEQSRNLGQSSFCDRFFNIPECNRDMPSFSNHIQVITEAQQPKIVASRDIPIGTVVAQETAYISAVQLENRFHTCHYCLKWSLNLKPCDNCCCVLFCDDHCKDKSIQDGHDIECKFIDFLANVDIKYKAVVKAVIKMRKTFESWEDFISATQDICVGKMRRYSPDNFACDKISLLYTSKEQHFICGTMFNDCIFYAHQIHYLDTMTTFLPSTPDERVAAIRALARTLMYLTLYCPLITTAQSAQIVYNQELEYDPDNYFFQHIGMLNHSCVPNTYMVAMGNTAALVTTMPVKQGTELTVSYVEHWVEQDPEELNIHSMKLYSFTKIVCDCLICSNDQILFNQPLNNRQKVAFRRFIQNTPNTSILPFALEMTYENVCRMLNILNDVPYSEEYGKTLNLLFVILKNLAVHNFRNILLGSRI